MKAHSDGVPTARLAVVAEFPPDAMLMAFDARPFRTLAEIEKMAILQTLQRTNWNKQEAAQILGLYRPTLYSKMKKHDIRDAGKSARASAAQTGT